MWTVDGWYREARTAAEADRAQIRKMADVLVVSLEQMLPDLPRTEVARRLQESNRERLEAVPDLRKYPELRGMRELVEAGWRGTQDGAGLSDAQAAAYHGFHFYMHRRLNGGQQRATGCSYVFFPTSDHGPILANNLDASLSEPFTAPGWPAISEHLLVGGVSSGVFMDEESPEVFPVPIWKLVGRYCRDTDEAVEMLTRYKLFWGPGNAIVIDRQKNVAMIEKSACRIGVRRSPDGFGFITAMTAEEPTMQAYLQDRRTASILARGLPKENADAIYWKAQDRRRELMNELLDEARKNPTVETLRKFIQFRSTDRGNVCCNGEVLFPGGPEVEYTLKTTIWLLREGQAQWWAREGNTPSFENRKPDKSFQGVWLWD